MGEVGTEGGRGKGGREGGREEKAYLEHGHVVNVAFPAAGCGGDGQMLAREKGVNSSGLMRKPTGDA